MKQGTQRILTYLRLLLLLGAVAVGALAITRDAAGFLQALSEIGSWNSLLAFLLIMGGLIATAEVWRSAVFSLAGFLRRRDAHRIFFVSQLGKYLPGGVWTVVSQVEQARRYGLSYTRMGLAALLFICLLVTTGASLAMLLLPWMAPDLLSEHSWILGIAPLLIVAMIPRVLTWLMNFALSVFKRPRLPHPLSSRDVLKPVALLGVVWVMFGSAAWLLTRPLTQVMGGEELFITVTGVFALAWVVGILVVLAPAGLGARELVIYIGISPIAGASGATSIAITLRVLHSLADLLLAAWVGPVSRAAQASPEAERFRRDA